MNETGVYFDDHFYDSYDFIIKNDELFFKEFYMRFINSSGLIKLAFSNTDMSKQYKMLRNSIQHMVEFYTHKEANDYLIRIARSHGAIHHIDGYMYKLFIDSFVEALEITYPDFTPSCAQAWEEVLTPGIEFMQSFKDS